MRRARFAGTWAILLTAITSLSRPVGALGQATDQAKAATPAQKVDDSIQAIDDDYNRQVIQLDRNRLEQLTRLASRQKPAEAAATYERLFRLAIAADLFRAAEQAAGKVLDEGTPSPTTLALAHLVKIVAEADRGAFEQSLRSLRQAVADSRREKAATGARAVLAPNEVIGICEAYYQRLVEANQFAIARDAFRLVLEQSYRPAVKDFLAGRLKRIELVGKPAPPIRGTDLDGKAFDLAREKGNVVLVVFWASWCLPNGAEIGWLEQVERASRDRGLHVVGINLDAQPDSGQKLETALPNIRRFLLDYNVPWPTLINGSGDHDYAGAYGIADIPANVLIARDGTVAQVDLSRRNLETVVSQRLGRQGATSK